MSTHQSSASVLVSKTGTLNVPAVATRIGQSAGVQFFSARIGKLLSTVGPSGAVVLATGIVLAFCCTAWAILQGISPPLAIMAGYCTVVGGACSCAALLVIQRVSHKTTPNHPAARPTSRLPNYEAWKLVSKLRVSDASRLWCDIEPGCPASQESIAWAHAMLDAIKRGELPVSARQGDSQAASKPTWHTEIARDALESWARAHGQAPRFLEI